MSINPDHIDFLMARDGEVADGAEATVCAILQVRDYLRTHKLQVKAFFKGVKALGDSISLFWDVDTWEARMSNANKVLTTFESKDAPGWVSAMVALHAWNDDRVANGDRVCWSLQGIYNSITAPTRTPKVTTVTEAVTEAPVTVVADAEPKSTQLDVALATLVHLSAQELGTLAAAVAQERTRKSTLTIAA
jgi:hypothetical protein